MSKRAIVMGLAVGIGLATLQGSTAEAGWTYVRPPGTWWYFGSIDGCAVIQQVRNPEQFPAQLRCEVKVTEVETLCENPNNHNVLPGQAATQVVFVGQNTIDSYDLLNSKSQKDKNKAGLCVKIDDSDCSIDPLTGEPKSPLCSPEFCVNPNWHPIDVLTMAFEATCTSEQCTGTDPNPCSKVVVKDTQKCECRLPAGWNVQNKPTPCPDPLRPTNECTPYECFEIVNGVTTNNVCGIQ